jgi:hypothetical protein
LEEIQLRIFTKKAFNFKDRENNQHVKTRSFEFTDVPVWVKKDPIFAWGVKDGDIELMSSKKDERKIELEDSKKPRNNGK